MKWTRMAGLAYTSFNNSVRAENGADVRQPPQRITTIAAVTLLSLEAASLVGIAVAAIRAPLVDPSPERGDCEQRRGASVDAVA